MKTSTKKRRGYLLLEGLVGSAVLGAALVGMYNQIGAMDRELSEAARRGIANAAVEDGFAKARSASAGWYSGSLSSGCTGSTAPCENDLDLSATTGLNINVAPDMIRRTITITGAIATGSTSRCQDCREVTVSVRYRDGTRNWKTIRAVSYVYPL